MIKWIRGMFSGTIYIQLWEERIKLALVDAQEIYDERPYIAIAQSKGKTQVKAIGNEAYSLKGTDGIEVSNPFSHPRLLVNGFEKAEKVLQHGIREVCNARIFNPSPVVVIHPREKLEGGITDVECRLFRELALGAGARKVLLHVGEELALTNFNLDAVNEPENS